MYNCCCTKTLLASVPKKTMNHRFNACRHKRWQSQWVTINLIIEETTKFRLLANQDWLSNHSANELNLEISKEFVEIIFKGWTSGIFLLIGCRKCFAKINHCSKPAKLVFLNKFDEHLETFLNMTLPIWFWRQATKQWFFRGSYSKKKTYAEYLTPSVMASILGFRKSNADKT